MTKSEVKKLHNGDEVIWVDPETDSRYTITIADIKIEGNIACIRDVGGDYIECFFKELV